MKSKETWKDIKGYEGYYQISNLGNVKSTTRNKILKPYTDTNGYFQVSLYNNSIRTVIRVHKLVAENFIDKPLNNKMLVIDHINNIKTDNRVSNLRFVTNRENCSKDKKGTSIYTGVSWSKKDSKWLSQIKLNNKEKTLYLGLFNNEIEAYNTYKKALKYITENNSEISAKQLRDIIKPKINND